MTQAKSKLIEYFIQNQTMKTYNEYMGCSLNISQDLKQQVDDLPNSPFKFYIECQNNLILKYEEITDYIEMYYPDLTPETDILTMIFYIHHKYMTQAISNIDKQQLKNTALTLQNKTKQLTVSPHIAQIGQFFGSIILSEYIDYLEWSIKVQKEFLNFYPEFLQKINDNESLYQIYLDTNMVAFPLKLVQLIYGKNLLKNGFYEEAIEILKQVDQMHVHIAETMYGMNQQNVAQAALYLKRFIPDNLEFKNKLTEQFKYENVDLLEMNMKTPDFPQFTEKDAEKYVLEITVLGEFWNNPYLFLLAISSAKNVQDNEKTLENNGARALRDLGSYYLTEFNQYDLSASVKQAVVYNAGYLFQASLKLDPTNRSAIENLITIYLAINQQLDEAKVLLQFLIAQHGDTEKYYVDLALIENRKKNFKAAQDHLKKAIKITTKPSPQTILQLLQTLHQIYTTSGMVDSSALLDAIQSIINTLHLFSLSSSGRDGDKKIIYIQNFIYQIHDPTTTLINAVISTAKEKQNAQMLQKMKQLTEAIVKNISLFLATQAGNEVLYAYLDILKRFE